MRSVFTVLVSLILGVGLLTGCTSSSSSSDGGGTSTGGDVSSYFPFTAGRTWTYNNASTGTTRTTIVCNGTKTFQGATCQSLTGTTVETNSNHISELYLQNTDAGIVLVGNTDRDSNSTTTDVFVITPAQIWLPKAAAAGYTWTQSVTVNTDATNYPVTYAGSVSKETITVPAGTYTDCLKTTITMSQAGTVVSTTTMWFAANVGLVRRDFSSTDPNMEPNGSMVLKSVTN